MKQLLLLLLFNLSFIHQTAAAATKKDKTAENARQAKELFTGVYQKVFGPQGSSLGYAVNIVGMYKTQGKIIYKGKKLHYEEKRFCSWQNGITAYMVDKEKHLIKIFRADDDQKDKYMSKFKYDVNNFDYSYQTEGDYYLVTAKLRKTKLFGIRHVTAKIRRSDQVPVALTIKLAFFHTTIQITDFHSGGITDDVFTFPQSRFQGYDIEDHR